MTTNEANILTSSGLEFHPFNPQLDQISIEDIAHGISLECRWGRQSKFFYSVADHSIMVSKVAEWLATDENKKEAKLGGLFHDATEAYIGDCPAPIKKSLPQFMALEDGIWQAIALKFGLSYILRPEIHHADIIVRIIEAKQVLIKYPRWLDEVQKEYGLTTDDIELVRLKLDLVCNPSSFEHSKENFLNRYKELIS